MDIFRLGTDGPLGFAIDGLIYKIGLGDELVRASDYPFITHHGIVMYLSPGRELIAHAAKEGGVRLDTYETFAGHRSARIERRPTDTGHASLILHRAQAVLDQGGLEYSAAAAKHAT